MEVPERGNPDTTMTVFPPSVAFLPSSCLTHPRTVILSFWVSDSTVFSLAKGEDLNKLPWPFVRTPICGFVWSLGGHVVLLWVELLPLYGRGYKWGNRREA